MSFHHLTSSDRARLAALKRAGHNQKRIAALLGKDPSTISRELRRNKTRRGYHARIAGQKASQRRLHANQRFRKLVPGARLTAYVTTRLKQYWSPEQIAGRLARETGTQVISYPTIYAFILAHAAYKRYLRHQKPYRRRYGTKKREKQRELDKKRWIDARPEIVNNRRRVGDWEGDTVLGKDGGSPRLLTYVERKSGKAVAAKLAGGTGQAERVTAATEARFRHLPKRKRLSLTYDNGVEFSDFERIEKRTGMTVYFAHPYHSWERGTNENTNGLYRQFFPKKHDFTNTSQQDIDRVTRLLNTRPRKRHHYRTPDEVFRSKK